MIGTNQDNNFASGWIGGFNVGASAIIDTANSMGISSLLTTADDVRFWAGDTYENRATAPFSVTRAGILRATGAIISGNITATTGAIGGWTLGATSLTSGSGATTVGLDSGGTNPALYAGSATPGSAPFRVTNAGALTASNANITGTITSSAGTIGGFTIGATTLTGAGLEPIVLDSNGAISIGTNSASNYFLALSSGYNGSGGSFRSLYNTKKVLILDTHPSSPGRGEISVYDSSETRNVFISGLGTGVFSDFVDVGNYFKVGGVSGYSGSFNPALVTNITVVGGIITAVS